MKKEKLYALVGPTASGKSSAGIYVATHLGGCVLGCDSMQIYKEMDIGTAKPTKEERAIVPHFLVDFQPPEIPFSVADYLPLAMKAKKEAEERGQFPLFVGGTGLYLDALLRGTLPESPETDTALREELFAFAEEKGNHALWEMLKSVDEESATAIHENNVKRVVRAIELYRLTGKTKVELDAESRENGGIFEPCVAGIFFSDKALLNEKIDRRIDEMMKNGLLEETEKLKKSGVFEKNNTAAQAIGYKELLPYFDGIDTLENCVEKLKIATHQYAKRQMTWFRGKNYVHWFEGTDTNIKEKLLTFFEENL